MFVASRQGFHSPDFFGVRCKGAAQLLSDGRAIPSLTIASNSFLGISNLFGAKRRAFTNTGGSGVVLHSGVLDFFGKFTGFRQLHERLEKSVVL